MAIRTLSTSATSGSRIKWRHTHAPFYFTKKTAKHPDEPLTAANRAFVQEVLKDTFRTDAFGDRYAYVRPQEAATEGEPVLKDGLEPWPRGQWNDEGQNTTRVGLIGRKIGVVPMWRKDGRPVMASMVHVS